VGGSALAHEKPRPAMLAPPAAPVSDRGSFTVGTSEARELPRTPDRAWPAALAALAVLVVLRRPRDAQVLALVACLTALTVESGVHAVHHAMDSPSASSCAFFAATQHTLAAGVESPEHVPPTPPCSEVRSVVDDRPAVHAHRATPPERAPPPLSLA
jgi:hypothetical protein